MIIGVIALIALAVLVGRAKARKGRLPALTHDYSSQRAVYQRWPTASRRRRFK